MPSENTSEPRRLSKSHNAGAPPQENDHLPCPRCESTNTKFCYYNNYNFSQPRHFCKSCRRYWTNGGTIRDIPIGGGTRKNRKRSRTVASSSPAPVSSLSSQNQALHTTATPFFVCQPRSPPATMEFGAAGVSSADAIAKQNLNMYGSFTPLLHSTSQGPGFVALAGFGTDMCPSLEDVKFGMRRGVCPFQCVIDSSAHDGGHVRPTGIANMWQFHHGGGRFVGGDCFT